MPVKPENRGRYPADWREISTRIRFERAGGRCECVGECGLDHTDEGGRCASEHLGSNPRTGARVILTTAHRPGREPEQCDDGDLLAACQQCHNRIDGPMRSANRRATMKARSDAQRRKVLEVAGRLAFALECALGRPIGRLK